jgi:hypothetical protein
MTDDLPPELIAEALALPDDPREGDALATPAIGAVFVAGE